LREEEREEGDFEGAVDGEYSKRELSVQKGSEGYFNFGFDEYGSGWMVKRVEVFREWF